jgi:hypothetical protein
VISRQDADLRVLDATGRLAITIPPEAPRPASPALQQRLKATG